MFLILKETNKLFSLICSMYLLLFAAIPFSVAFGIGSHKIELPSEAIMLFLAGLFFLYLYKEGRWFKKKKWSLISIMGLTYLVWMAVGIPFSSAPSVSLKYCFISLLHWFLFYLGMRKILAKRPLLFHRLILAYSIFFGMIMIYAGMVYAQYDFRIDASVLIARPFYFDHALYGCCLSLLLGGVAIIIRMPAIYSGLSRGIRFVGLFIFIFFVLCVYFSYSRAVWLSLVLGLSFILIVHFFKMRFWQVILFLLTVGIAAILLFPKITDHLSGNEVESKKGDWKDQIVSVLNVKTDVSNRERLNRYSCAWRMFKDRPIFGYGAGTFQKAYLPYQKPGEMTRISVTHAGPHPPGRGGGAHSEYFQALSEMGLIGFLIWVGLLIAVLWTGLDIFHCQGEWWKKYSALFLLFGLLTFFIHAVFNNFLHNGKIAVLVWSFMAFLDYLNEKESR